MEMVVHNPMKKKKQSALQAWKMLLLSLPKGIAAFVTVVAGLSVSLPLSVFLVGLPLLAETLVLGSRMMVAESLAASAWKAGLSKTEVSSTGSTVGSKWAGWRSLLAVLGQSRSYRSIVYSLVQLPVGIAAFTLAIVLPVCAWAVLLSPLAYQVSLRIFSFPLFADDLVIHRLLPGWSPFERSWAYAGAGVLLVLLMPFLLRTIARLYTAWVVGIAGELPQAASASSDPSTNTFPTEVPETVYAHGLGQPYSPIPTESMDSAAADVSAPPSLQN
jgi:hypothetical protein